MSTVAELLGAREDDDNVGLRFEDMTWTWREVVGESARRARWLLEHRRPGPFHIGVLLENVPEYLFLLGGAALAGATVVGINPTRRGAELRRDVAHTDCQLVVTDAEQLGLLTQAEVEEEVVLAEDPAYLGALAGHRADLDGLGDVAEDLLYLLLFTSGSTGAPKAVKVSQGRLAAAGEVMAKGSGFGPADALYCSMPLFHGNALNACVVPAVASGAPLVLRRRFSASGFLPDVRRYGITYFNYVGRALSYILATPERPDDGDNTLKFGFGTDASPQDITAFKRRFHCPIVEGYGSSEGAISMSRVPGTPRGSLGVPPPGMDVVVVDPDTGTERPHAVFDDQGRLRNPEEAIGEIVSRDGATRFEGYYANEEAETERTRNGWYWSGDLGYRDEAGYFFFAGRTADWLRVDGENFAAAPVERILERFAGVRAAVVYAVPDPRTGDQVMATLELADPGAFDAAAFAAFLAEQPDLGTKWAPRFVRLTEAVPVTGTGKVDKRPLRATRWETEETVWWRP
ncbi:MAG TPA: AMP-binding protein, partial [Acidimicrobiales bacterium]|nr:AMP-binding protein [Acidimicrobiales bacterium]